MFLQHNVNILLHQASSVYYQVEKSPQERASCEKKKSYDASFLNLHCFHTFPKVAFPADIRVPPPPSSTTKHFASDR